MPERVRALRPIRAPGRSYTRHDQSLARRIAAQGALVTEFPPCTPSLLEHFPQRNRIISGLSRATLVEQPSDILASLGTAAALAPEPGAGPECRGGRRVRRAGNGERRIWPDTRSVRFRPSHDGHRLATYRFDVAGCILHALDTGTQGRNRSAGGHRLYPQAHRTNKIVTEELIR